ncbi:MAG: glutamine--fructose-6-phosphate transaminase (isomerizing) [Oscillospiraceae bacterium]|jgi:glucosamine--fructose-6-phosphate aminotransferase (isomerizing)|nr:glutamine--fructose-6-phosphate transaminase (isomerizing) [Oscillospiraceae bacterium]
MCGIVGYTGREDASPVLLDGLRRLEYRGYDSAGIVVAQGGTFTLAKSSGHVARLDELTRGGRDLPGNIGLGHTRWATHGQPTDTNAHPHISDGGKIAVVHNGIIENYARLREFLRSKGMSFQSQTDTEVATNLIAYFYAESGDILSAVASAARRMEGSYALGIMCEDMPGTLIATRRENPLVLGFGDGCNYLASDVAAILLHTRRVIRLADFEIAALTADSVTLYTGELDKLEREPETIEWDVSAAEKGGYEHFMIKEIMEQPEVVRKTLSPRIRNGEIILDGAEITDEYIRALSRIYIVACGSASYAGVVGKYSIEKLARIPAEVVFASEFRYCDPVLNANTLVICVSQSGTTADTIAAMREAKARGAKVLSIVNVVGSTIAEESDWTLYTWAGPEICVASTKGYSTQLALLYVLALRFARAKNTLSDAQFSEAVAALLVLPDKMEETLGLREELQYLASQYFSRDDMYYIGRGTDYALCLEACLKLKEISYIHSEAFAAGEMKHGPIALINRERETLVVAVATNRGLVDKTVSNIIELCSRGARVITVTTQSARTVIEGNDDIRGETVAVSDFYEAFLPSLAIIPLQFFAYYTALALGRDIDKPRNLAKSVTVE